MVSCFVIVMKLSKALLVVVLPLLSLAVGGYFLIRWILDPIYSFYDTTKMDFDSSKTSYWKVDRSVLTIFMCLNCSTEMMILSNNIPICGVQCIIYTGTKMITV